MTNDPDYYGFRCKSCGVVFPYRPQEATSLDGEALSMIECLDCGAQHDYRGDEALVRLSGDADDAESSTSGP